MKCSNCQFINPDDSKFCIKCGQELTPSSVPSQTHYCTKCGSALEPDSLFCTKCGSSIPPLSNPPEKSFSPQKTKEKRPLSSACKFTCVLGCFLLFDFIIFFFILHDISLRRYKAMEEAQKITAQVEAVAEKVADAESKMQHEEYAAASTELAQSLSEYLDILKENDETQDIILPYADAAYSSYSEAVQKYVAELNEQSDYIEAYRQADDALAQAVSQLDEWSQNGWTADSSGFLQLREELPSIYKGKYITLFNELRSSDNWSYETAWQYMQEAESILQWSSPDDPIASRYAYTLAGITHREIAVSLDNGNLSYADAVSQILSVLETADYNPNLMVDLCLYLEAIGDTQHAASIRNACNEVYNYLAYTENIYIAPGDFLIEGKSSNASSTISLKDFYYFNDFGEFSISDTNGISPEGKQYIRNTFKAAVSSI